MSLSVVSVVALRANTVLLSILFLFMFLLHTLSVHFVCKHLNYRATRRMVVMNMVKLGEREREDDIQERRNMCNLKTKVT